MAEEASRRNGGAGDAKRAMQGDAGSFGADRLVSRPSTELREAAGTCDLKTDVLRPAIVEVDETRVPNGQDRQRFPSPQLVPPEGDTPPDRETSRSLEVVAAAVVRGDSDRAVRIRLEYQEVFRELETC